MPRGSFDTAHVSLGLVPEDEHGTEEEHGRNDIREDIQNERIDLTDSVVPDGMHACQ